MPRFKFVGGSQDGNECEVGQPTDVGMELRLPSHTGRAKVEVYVLRPDGQFHFERYGVPPISAATDQGLADKSAGLISLLNKLGPLIEELEEYCRVNGYTPLTIAKWDIIRRDQD